MAYRSEILRKPLKIGFDVGYKNSRSSGKRPVRSKASEDAGLEPHSGGMDGTGCARRRGRESPRKQRHEGGKGLI